MPKVTLDRFEEALAVLIVDGREVTRPRAELVSGALPGAVVVVMAGANRTPK